MTTTRRTATTLAPLAAALALAAALGGCSVDGSSAAAAGTTTRAATPGPATVIPVPTIEVVATDVAFAGLPPTLRAGPYDLAFTNVGHEEHELVLFRNTSGLSLDELAERGPEAASLVELAGNAHAGAGARADHDTPVELTPGVYTVACFVPAGDGRPRASHGMHATIAVS